MTTPRDRSSAARALTDRLPSFMRPPQMPDAVESARGEMFHWVLWWALLLELVLGPWVVLASTNRSAATVIQVLVVAFLVLMLWLVRRRLALATALTVVAAWFIAAGDVVATGGTSSLALGGFALLVLVAGFFWNERAATVVGVASIALVIALQLVGDERIPVVDLDLARYTAVTAIQLVLTMVVLAAGLRIMRASRRESELRARELREVIAEMPNGVIILTRRGRIAALNPAAEVLTGYSFARVEGKKLWELGSASERANDAAQGAFSTAMRGGFAEPVTLDYDRPDGEVVPVEVTARRVTRGDGRRALMLVLRDLTDHRRQERVRGQLETRLRQMERLESVGRLAGGIAHDFNNLLTVILTNTELLLMDPEPGPNWRDDINHVRDAARRGASLTRQLLTFARQEPPPEDTSDINAFLAESEDLLRKLVGPEVRLKLRIDTGLAPVNLTRTQIEQVVMNLVANASTAAGTGGTVAVRTHTIFVGARQTPPGVGLDSGDYVRVRVEDDGEGMPAEVLDHIFEPFFTTRRGSGGTGLGLATVHGIVRGVGGDIYVESEPGAGTTFDVYIPRAEQAASSLPPRSHDPAAFTPRGGGRPLLLVEDEAPVADVARRLLERDLWDVVWASGVEEARSLYRSRKFAAVVCDVVMNDGQGPDLIAELEAESGPVPVVYVSGYAEVDLGDAPLVHKPFRGRELTAAVRDAVLSND